MRERVEFIPGKKPIILVAPHGAKCDSIYTDIIVEAAASNLDCYAVINRGFERSSNVDVLNDKADCNRIDHIKKDVVREEFLNPIVKAKDKLKTKQSDSLKRATFAQLSRWESNNILILYILGCPNQIHSIANEPVECIVGYGRGKQKDSITCSSWRKNLFVDTARLIAGDGGDVFEGKGDGKYSGRNSNELNQYFRKHAMDRWVDSLQIIFPQSLRDSPKSAEATGIWLSCVLDSMELQTDYDNEPHPKFV